MYIYQCDSAFPAHTSQFPSLEKFTNIQYLVDEYMGSPFAVQQSHTKYGKHKMVYNTLPNLVKGGGAVLLPLVDASQGATPVNCIFTSKPSDLTSKIEAAENEKTISESSALPPCPHCEIQPFPDYDDPYLRADHPFWKGNPPEDVVHGIHRWDPPPPKAKLNLPTRVPLER